MCGVFTVPVGWGNSSHQPCNRVVESPDTRVGCQCFVQVCRNGSACCCHRIEVCWNEASFAAGRSAQGAAAAVDATALRQTAAAANIVNRSKVSPLLGKIQIALRNPRSCRSGTALSGKEDCNTRLKGMPGCVGRAIETQGWLCCKRCASMPSRYHRPFLIFFDSAAGSRYRGARAGASF